MEMKKDSLYIVSQNGFGEGRAWSINLVLAFLGEGGILGDSNDARDDGVAEIVLRTL